jgi:hypothetical protein
MGHKEEIEELEAYFKKIPDDRDPETEEEFFYSLEFWARFMVNQAASMYARHPLGIISYDTVIDEDEVTRKFSPGFLEVINDLVKLSCEKFGLTPPGAERIDSQKSFEEWFNSATEKYKRKARYDERIFNNKNCPL